jgi:hypothetical protein
MRDGFRLPFLPLFLRGRSRILYFERIEFALRVVNELMMLTFNIKFRECLIAEVILSQGGIS